MSRLFGSVRCHVLTCFPTESASQFQQQQCIRVCCFSNFITKGCRHINLLQFQRPRTRNVTNIAEFCSRGSWDITKQAIKSASLQSLHSSRGVGWDVMTRRWRVTDPRNRKIPRHASIERQPPFSWGSLHPFHMRAGSIINPGRDASAQDRQTKTIAIASQSLRCSERTQMQCTIGWRSQSHELHVASQPTRAIIGTSVSHPRPVLANWASIPDKV